MLSVEHISKSFFRKQALDDVSLGAEKGEIFGLLGPNGAGKTTLIRIINRIVEPDNGVVRINGAIMTRKHLEHIGYMPEERGLYKSMTVEDHAVFLGRLRGLSKQDVTAKLNYWLDKFEIGDWKKKRIEELSKGMAQKVQFICTVLHEPELLILDEPYSGFDPINTELIKNELIHMRNQGKTIVLSTHNMKSVEEICDRVALIHHSKKLLEGRVADIQEERKEGLYAIRFRGNMIAFANALWSGFEVVDTENPSDNLFIVRVKMRGENTFDDLLKVLIGQVKIEAAWEVLPTMQDIFISIVQPKLTEAL
ncbi:ABC transporter ATP-binding protein [Crocinitomicaceae bacterium CZZ-1]|uniref:ABC transporter ATP-binding protein n=1 Tax=Taishania pollutisoli TaxID=2766479 RepID=A0A8J6PHK7_9FLAO|nr:ATP-binding cassette domain-containing protein [Taishania pollutisoli]MBC9811706.1 ABC transporter ATP-binding protein [Taishania pollutisoli]MBX2948359.1 ATP-binding cassette domain-containing protein [Crocinitomicaceae bacterium]NGF75457.1 ABC transporter ATP-binding protein [Fluviicola sp. SGL-29]